MARACEDPLSIDDNSQARLLQRPVRIPTPRWLHRLELPVQSELAGKAVTGAARVVVLVFPAILAIVGLIVALAAGMLAQRDSTEAIGTLGIEIGAAMWFAGAVTLGARPRPTVLRVVLIGATGLGGLALITAALFGAWSGVALDLAMEFGVGAVAIVVLDLLILGVIQENLERLARSRTPVVPA
jgi:hypothetical protein